MNPYFNKLLLVATVVTALTIQASASSASAAGPSLGYSKGKPYYGASDQRGAQSRMSSRSMYQSTAPVIVQSERAPEAVAQAPTERQSFSYEPSQQAVSGGCGCGGTVVTEEAPATSQRSTETRRSYSYEPSTSDSYSTPSAPRMRSQSSRTPKFLLPKTDPGKYRN